jgi:hypothetical protein
MLEASHRHAHDESASTGFVRQLQPRCNHAPTNSENGCSEVQETPSRTWWALLDSNQRPIDYESVAPIALGCACGAPLLFTSWRPLHAVGTLRETARGTLTGSQGSGLKRTGKTDRASVVVRCRRARGAKPGAALTSSPCDLFERSWSSGCWPLAPRLTLATMTFQVEGRRTNLLHKRVGHEPERVRGSESSTLGSDHPDAFPGRRPHRGPPGSLPAGDSVSSRRCMYCLHLTAKPRP